MSEDTKTEEFDLRHQAAKLEAPRQAREQMVRILPTDDYVAVSPYTPLSQAIEAMKNDEGGCVIISDDGRVAGIFTERDLINRVFGEEIDLESPISQWMQPAVETLSPEATVGDAVRLMKKRVFATSRW